MGVVAALVAAAVLVSTAAAAPAADVTLAVDTYREPGSRFLWRIQFSGTLASGAGGESVTIMGQRCGQNFSTAVAATTTRAGGFWQVTPDFPSIAPTDPATYRARWNDRLSEPVTIRPPIWIGRPAKQPGRRWTVFVHARLGSPASRDLRGRAVELQRLAAGQWTLVRRARLAAVGRFASFQVAFVVPARGLRLRVFVPAKTAAPCYGPAASTTWKS
jgi:hypothetical protein